jgi:serine/threonine protein phosphatase 1
MQEFRESALYYIIGDIHGHFDRLAGLIGRLLELLSERDTVIFLGDYIDRGPRSYEVVDFLVHLSRRTTFETVFLKGNHEDMLASYMRGEDGAGAYIFNGGDATIRSYTLHRGKLDLPEHHRRFFDGLRLYYEGEDFIAVHAGLDPKVGRIEAQSEHDLLWIREQFFRADKRWDKTVIFGHTPVSTMGGEGQVYVDEKRNIIGIDSGVMYGNPLTCISWPQREIFTG